MNLLHCAKTAKIRGLESKAVRGDPRGIQCKMKNAQANGNCIYDSKGFLVAGEFRGDGVRVQNDEMRMRMRMRLLEKPILAVLVATLCFSGAVFATTTGTIGNVGLMNYMSDDISVKDCEQNLVIVQVNGFWVYVDRTENPEMANMFWATAAKAKKDGSTLQVAYDNAVDVRGSCSGNSFYRLGWFQIR